MRALLRAALLSSLLGLVGCAGMSGMPEKVRPVGDFELQRYLGTWYEVARLDHSFERGLSRVSAQYALRDDGMVSVTNRGWSSKKGEWKEAVGKARMVGESDVGHLQVSFFGPFYASYVIFELDQDDYQYAFVSGPNTKYLWLLSRTPTVDPALIQRFRQRAEALDFDLNELILVEQP